MQYCPCGEPLVRKPRESKAAFEKRLYCNVEHRGVYHPQPVRLNFGLPRTAPGSRRKVGMGIMKYLYGKPLLSPDK